MRLSKIGFWLLAVLPIWVLGQTWKVIPNQTQGIVISYQKVLKHNHGKHHVFIGYRRSNSIVGKNNPMVYFQVESRKIQIFDMKIGVLEPPVYDSVLDAFIGVNRQPLLVWKLIPGEDSARIVFFNNDSNKVFDNMTFSFRKEKDGWYYGTTTPKGKFFRVNPNTGVIENLGQAQVLDGPKNVRRTGFFHAITPKGWAMNYRNDNSGEYFVYYQEKNGSNSYTTSIGFQKKPSRIYSAKDGSEVVAVQIQGTNKKTEWIILNEKGKILKNTRYSFPTDFETLPTPFSDNSLKLQKVKTNAGEGDCFFEINGKKDSFSFSLPTDLQKLKLVFFHPKYGWVGTSGVYQDIFFLDSLPSSSKFSFVNEDISTYGLGGKKSLYILGYPSKIGKYEHDSLKILISSNQFPKYFTSFAESDSFQFFLGKNDRDRTGFEIWRYSEEKNIWDNPWRNFTDSLSAYFNFEKIEFTRNCLLLLARNKSNLNLQVWKLTGNGVQEVSFSPKLSSFLVANNYCINRINGSLAFWKNDSLAVVQIFDDKKEMIRKITLTAIENKGIQDKMLNFVSGDRLILSGQNLEEKNAQIRLVNVKTQKEELMKSSNDPPRPFSFDGKNRCLFYGGNGIQNQQFDELTLPAYRS